LDAGAEMGLLDYFWTQLCQQEVTFRGCLLSQSKNALFFIACFQQA